ncbi:Isochorismatase hydrolase [Ophiobolus disseminans]|uniref:Isochorismatase hydrolase n=1 Tax=Ophiobolus disseminans TaxID=1469910 RepID=A0A6A6ZY16_9PLEO|nr:Isochorismatase hydrolase [Ophiobolus disseminans]
MTPPPHKPALLIINLQTLFLPMTTSCLSNIITLSRHFSARGWPQFFTQHGHPASDFEPPITNQLAKKWGVEASLHLHSRQWGLLDEVKVLVREAGLEMGDVIGKNVYDAFLGRLRGEGVGRVVVVGVMTDCCCDTAGRGAFNRGFETWMVCDTTGSVDQVQHEAGLKAWGHGYGDVIDTEEVLKRLG